MSGDAGTQMPEHEVDFQHCGSYYPGWLNGNHPTNTDQIVERQVKIFHPKITTSNGHLLVGKRTTMARLYLEIDAYVTHIFLGIKPFLFFKIEN